MTSTTADVFGIRSINGINCLGSSGDDADDALDDDGDWLDVAGLGGPSAFDSDVDCDRLSFAVGTGVIDVGCDILDDCAAQKLHQNQYSTRHCE